MFDWNNIYSEDDLIELKQKGASQEELLKAYAMIPKNNQRRQEEQCQERMALQKKILSERAFAALPPHTWSKMTLFKARKMVCAGADIEAKDVFGSTALINAAKHNLTDIVQYFLSLGAKVNAQNNSKETALMLTEKTQIAQMLIDYGADVNLKNVTGNSALNTATSRSKMLVLIQNGADVNAPDSTNQPPLIKAISFPAYSNDKLINEMIINKVNLNAQDGFGQTALHYADDPRTVSTLLLFSADPNIKDKQGRTALYIKKPIDCVKMLLEKGANVNVRDKSGLTPLMAAAGEGNFEKTALLLDNGANAKAVDFQGHTALSLVPFNRQNLKLISLLEARTGISYAQSRQIATIFEERSQKTEEILTVKNHALRRDLFKGVSHQMPINKYRFELQRN